ncbi:MAG: phage late control D family protein [Proteobacteria bacterium]|nr:phage late control D family protein [Pseudomonadota bacterium]
MAEKHNKTASFKISIGSAVTDATQQKSQGIESFTVEEHLDMVGVAQVTIRPSDNVDFSAFKIGDNVTIAVGGSSRQFIGFITGFRMTLQGNEPKMTVIAMDAMAKLASSRHTRTWPTDGNSAGSETVKDSDIVSEVLGKANVDAGTVTDTTGESKYVFQRNESDLNFLKRLAARNGFLLRAVEGKINFEKAEFTGEAVKFDYKTCKGLEYTWSPIWVPPKLKVHGWDYATKKLVSGEHDAVTGMGAGDDAIAFGNSAIWQEESHVSDVLVTSDAGAKGMAEAELERLGRNFLRGRVIVDGSGEAFPGQKIEVTGFGKHNPTGYIVSCRHIVTTGPDDFRTEVHFCGNTAPA